MVGPGPKLCRTCETAGMHTPATRILPSGGGRCEEHFRKEAGLPPLKSASGKEIHSMVPAVKIGAEARSAAAEERENIVKNKEDGRASKLDAAAMQRDRDAGISVAEIAKKNHCNPGSVYNHTKGSGEKRIAHWPSIAKKTAAALSTDGRHGNRGRPPAGGGGTKAKRGRPRKLAASTPGGGFDNVIENLRQHRADLAGQLARIDRAIAALEETG